jgi:hypothetical protein
VALALGSYVETRLGSSVRQPLLNGRQRGINPRLGPDLFGGQVVNALLYCVGLSETDPSEVSLAG